MLNKFLVMTLILTSYLTINFAHAEHQTPDMPLIRSDKSKACDLSPSLKLETDNNEVQNFKIETNQKIKVTLINKSHTACYKFDYVPSYSPILIYKMTENKLVITEMIGTFENGHQLENTYKIKMHPLSLVFIKAKFIDFIRYENPNTKRSEVQKVVTDY